MTGALLMSGGVAMGTLMFASLKLLGEGYSPFQIIFFRSLFQLPLLLVAWRWNHPFGDILKTQKKAQILRTAVLSVGLLLGVYAVSHIPLFEYSSLFFSAPFFIVIFSAFLLKEKLHMSLIGALVLGFAGVLIILQPKGSLVYELGSCAALLSALFYGGGLVLTKKMTAQNSPLLMTLWWTMTCLFVGFAGTLWSGFSMGLEDAFVFLLAALLNIGSNILQTKSFQHENASFLAPFEYVELPIALFVGYAFWAEIPNSSTFIGIPLIALGSWILLRKKPSQTREGPSLWENPKKALIIN